MDRSDAPLSRPGQAVTVPVEIRFGVGPDGNLVLDVPDDEMVGRALFAWGQFEMDRYYTNKRMMEAMARAKENRVVEGALGLDAPRLERKLRGLR